MPGTQASRIEDSLNRFGTCENSRRGQFPLLSNCDDLSHPIGTRGGSKIRRLLEVPRWELV